LEAGLGTIDFLEEFGVGGECGEVEELDVLVVWKLKIQDRVGAYLFPDRRGRSIDLSGYSEHVRHVGTGEAF